MSATDKGCGSILHGSYVLQVGIRIPQLQWMVGTLTWAGRTGGPPDKWAEGSVLCFLGRVLSNGVMARLGCRQDCVWNQLRNRQAHL